MSEKTEARIEFTKPPHWDRVVAALPAVSWDTPIAFAYGNTIYTNVKNVQKHLIVHEMVHMEQQAAEGMTVELWWDKYLTDPAFRLEQEIPAYRAQYFYVKSRNSVRVSNKFLDQCAFALASDTYGNLLSFQEAKNRIRRV